MAEKECGILDWVLGVLFIAAFAGLCWWASGSHSVLINRRTGERVRLYPHDDIEMAGVLYEKTPEGGYFWTRDHNGVIEKYPISEWLITDERRITVEPAPGS